MSSLGFLIVLLLGSLALGPLVLGVDAADADADTVGLGARGESLLLGLGGTLHLSRQFTPVQDRPAGGGRGQVGGLTRSVEVFVVLPPC